MPTLTWGDMACEHVQHSCCEGKRVRSLQEHIQQGIQVLRAASHKHLLLLLLLLLSFH